MSIDGIVDRAEKYLELLPPTCREFEAPRVMRELIEALKDCERSRIRGQSVVCRQCGELFWVVDTDLLTDEAVTARCPMCCEPDGDSNTADET